MGGYKSFVTSKVLPAHVGVGLSYVIPAHLSKLRGATPSAPGQLISPVLPSSVAPPATWYPGLEGRERAMRYPAREMWAWGGGGWQAATFSLVDDLLVLLGAGGAHSRDPSLLLTSRERRLSYHNMQSAGPPGPGW